jgi:hypothetical protein
MPIGARVEETVSGDKIEPKATGVPDRKAATSESRGKLLSLPGCLRF